MLGNADNIKKSQTAAERDWDKAEAQVRDRGGGRREGLLRPEEAHCGQARPGGDPDRPPRPRPEVGPGQREFEPPLRMHQGKAEGEIPQTDSERTAAINSRSRRRISIDVLSPSGPSVRRSVWPSCRSSAYAAEMPGEKGNFTVRGDPWYVRESLLIESGLATALDDDDEPFEAELLLNADQVRDQADRIASADGPEAARRVLIREARRLTRWERSINLGLAGNDADDPARLSEAVRSHLATLAMSAVVYGFQSGVPAEHLMNEVVAAGALDIGGLRESAVRALVVCYRAAGHPDLALSLLARSPGADPAWDVRTLLDAARQTYAVGRSDRIADLAGLAAWPADPTGLVREMIRRLVTEREPSPAELAARVDLRGRAMDAGDWSGLRELALSDVMWLAEDPTLWRALSAILRMNGEAERADLAGRVSDLVAAERQKPR